MNYKINWIGVAGGAATLLLIAVSLFVPWWKFTVGTAATGSPAFAEANFSPVNLNFSILGNALSIPIIWALNMAALLTLLSGGLIMLIYSVKPEKSYSKKLLGFSWNKPLFAVVLFVVELVALGLLAKSVAGFDVPLMGASTIHLPNLASGISISIGVIAAFEWPFYLAIVVAGLCVAARLYHRKVVGTSNIPLPPTLPN
jgi:hypothetical protein